MCCETIPGNKTPVTQSDRALDCELARVLVGRQMGILSALELEWTTFVDITRGSSRYANGAGIETEVKKAVDMTTDVSHCNWDDEAALNHQLCVIRFCLFTINDL